jgi:hypothetical protein
VHKPHSGQGYISSSFDILNTFCDLVLVLNRMLPVGPFIRRNSVTFINVCSRRSKFLHTSDTTRHKKTSQSADVFLPHATEHRLPVCVGLSASPCRSRAAMRRNPATIGSHFCLLPFYFLLFGPTTPRLRSAGRQSGVTKSSTRPSKS